MIADAELIRSEPHVQVGAILERDAEPILARWTQRAAIEQPNARRLHFDALRDHLPELLRAIGRSLAAGGNGDTDAHRPPAAVHGEQRWEAGWALPEVVRDYQILRLVLLDHLDEQLNRPLTPREHMAVGLALDEAIAASVASHAAFAEAEQRRRQTEREEHLKQHAATLADADRHKNEFLAVLGHELRNPLAPIRNALHLLRRRGDTETLAWVSDLIGRQVDNLTRLADDLLDVTRLARGKLSLRTARLDLADLVRTAVADHQPVFRAASRTLTADLPAAPAWVRGDAVRLAQVVGNLLSNALKFTDPGGTVAVRLTCDAAAGRAVLEVADDGIGIDPEFLPHVFRRFAQGDTDPGREPGGLGLGLAVVHGLVALHGGEATAASPGPGKGATFTVTLPLDGAAPANGGEPLTPTPAKLQVLVIEDNRDAADSLALLLQLFGHEVRVAYNGPDGVALAREAPPDVVFCDLGLPGKDGYAVARELKAAADGGMMLIALSGHGSDADRQRCQEAGFARHFVKPVDPEELKQLLEERVKSKQP
jgi:signal transduction histidine kinase/ActR/RegA family two-component response regulator